MLNEQHWVFSSTSSPKGSCFIFKSVGDARGHKVQNGAKKIKGRRKARRKRGSLCPSCPPTKEITVM